MIDDLLVVTKFEVGAIKMDLACFDMRSLLSEAVEAVKMTTLTSFEFFCGKKALCAGR
ncbi:MAG: hypothetical protein ACLFTW_02195 [Chitinispirillaceae bacterium]